MPVMHLLCYVAKLPNLELKAYRPEQLLDYLHWYIYSIGWTKINPAYSLFGNYFGAYFETLAINEDDSLP
jgi:hypothetical protein